MAEEAAAIAFAGATRIAVAEAAFALLDAPSGSVIDRVRDVRLQDAIAQLLALQPELDSYAGESLQDVLARAAHALRLERFPI